MLPVVLTSPRTAEWKNNRKKRMAYDPFNESWFQQDENSISQKGQIKKPACQKSFLSILRNSGWRAAPPNWWELSLDKVKLKNYTEYSFLIPERGSMIPYTRINTQTPSYTELRRRWRYKTMWILWDKTILCDSNLIQLSGLFKCCLFINSIYLYFVLNSTIQLKLQPWVIHVVFYWFILVNYLYIVKILNCHS